MKLLIEFSDNGKIAIGWKIAAENLEEQWQLGTVRNLHFFGCDDAEMKYAGISTERIEVEGKMREVVCTLGFRQSKFNQFDSALEEGVRYEGLPSEPTYNKDFLHCHYLVVENIERALNKRDWQIKFPVLNDIYNSVGSPGKWDLAIQIATDFQELNKDRVWDGEFMDEVDKFTMSKLKG